MNRTFLFSLMSAAAVMASCGGKVLVDGLGPNDPEGVGGAGGAGTTSTGHSNSSVAGSTSGAGPAQTSSSSGPCDASYHCAEAITPPSGNPALLCPGSMSWNLYQTFVKCTCGGPCAASCGANLCISAPATMNCLTCAQDALKGCGKELNACANDL